MLASLLLLRHKEEAVYQASWYLALLGTFVLIGLCNFLLSRLSCLLLAAVHENEQDVPPAWPSREPCKVLTPTYAQEDRSRRGAFTAEGTPSTMR